MNTTQIALLAGLGYFLWSSVARAGEIATTPHGQGTSPGVDTHKSGLILVPETGPGSHLGDPDQVNPQSVIVAR